jgi:hypothetical protein
MRIRPVALCHLPGQRQAGSDHGDVEQDDDHNVNEVSCDDMLDYVSPLCSYRGGRRQPSPSSLQRKNIIVVVVVHVAGYVIEHLHLELDIAFTQEVQQDADIHDPNSC